MTVALLFRRYRLDALALAALAALAAAFFWRVLLERGVWVPMGGGDMASFVYPMFAFAAHTLEQGFIPLWNPSVHGGTPFAADLQSGLFYPLNWPALLRGSSFHYRDLEAVVLVHYPLAGVLTYCFARDLDLTRPAAWLAATVFMLSGFMVTHLGHANMLQSAAWLPAQLFLLRRALVRNDSGYAAGAGAAYTLAFFAGHTQVVMLQVAAGAAYLLAHPTPVPWLAPQSIRRRALLLALAGVVAAATSSLKAVPGFELTRHSVRSDLPYERATEFAAWPIGLANLLLPNLWGSNPTDYWGPWSNTEVFGYVGVLPLVLALLALILRPAFQARFFIALAAASILLSLGEATVLFGWVYRFVPGFDLVRAAGRYLYLFDFSIAISAAFGLQKLTGLVTAPDRDRLDERHIVRWFARGLLIALLAVSCFALPLYLSYQVVSPNLEPRVILAVRDVFFLSVFLAAALFLVGGVLYRLLSVRAVFLLALGATTLDVASAYHGFNPTTRNPILGFDHSDLVARLQGTTGTFRIDSETGAESTWQPDAANILGLQDAGGLFNPMQLATYSAFRKAGGRQPGSLAYDLLNVRYVIAPAGIRVDEGGLGPVAPDDYRLVGQFEGELALYEHRGATARARVVYAAEAADSPSSALRRLEQLSGGEAGDPRVLTVVEGPPLGDTDAVPVPSEASVLRYGPNEVDVQVDPTAEGYLVLADVFYPGWKVRVDGESRPIYRAYGVFRAVPVRPGDRLVTFEFSPLSWRLSWPVSLASWMLLALYLAWRATRRSRIFGLPSGQRAIVESPPRHAEH